MHRLFILAALAMQGGHTVAPATIFTAPVATQAAYFDEGTSTVRSADFLGRQVVTYIYQHDDELSFGHRNSF